MNKRGLLSLVLIVGLCHFPVADAAPQSVAQAEIDYLLRFIGASGCEFYRNGSWYDSKHAEAHLRNKYDILSSSERIDTAEDFIENAATKSSFSGLAYEVRCSGVDAVPSNAWLRNVLAQHRIDESSETKNAPREMRGATGIQESDSNRDVSLPSPL